MPFTNPEKLLYYSSTVELETYIDWAWGKQTPGPHLQSDRNTDFLLRQIEGAGGLPGKIINLFFSSRLEVAKKLIPWNKKSEGTFWLTQCFSLFSRHLLFLKAFSSVAQSCPTLRPHGLQHARPPCPSPTPGVHLNPCPLSRWCHPTISSSVIPFSSCLQSLPASWSFQMSQLFSSGGQRIGVSALISVLPMNTQDWFPLGWTGWISLQSKSLL